MWRLAETVYSLDGTQFVQTSVNMNEPVIYVAMNYRYVRLCDIFGLF